jgi:hypothetical protein
MSRFYYPAQRAHHAYTMALDFGMKFEKGSGFWTPEGILTVTGAGGYKLVIAEESIRLLEPHVGDVIRWTSSHGEPWEELHHRVITRGSPELHLFDTSAAKRSLSKRSLRASISERNGIPFHWPESSEA